MSTPDFSALSLVEAHIANLCVRLDLRRQRKEFIIGMAGARHSQ